MTTPNPFIRGYQDLYIRRELLITYDDHFEPCYRQMPEEQKDAADHQVAGHHCIFNDTHAVAVELGEITEDQHTLYPANGQIRAVVYAVRANENGEELHLGDTETLERAQGLVKRIQFETGFYSRMFEISSEHLPEQQWDELDELLQHANIRRLMIESFTLPDSNAIGFKLHATPWTDEHLAYVCGTSVAEVLAHLDEEGFLPETIKLLELAGQADVRILILDPDASVLEGLPTF